MRSVTRFLILLLSLFLPALPAGAQQEKDKRLPPGQSGWGVKKAEPEDPKLPRVLLIGDSILNGYRAVVVRELAGKANVDCWVNPYHQASGGLHQQLAAILKEGRYDVIHFNMGLHGWQKGRIPEGQFEPLTQKLVDTLKTNAPGAALVWASSTPVTVKGKPGRLDPEINPVIVEHNAMAAKVMKQNGIPVNDLYALLVRHLDLAAGDQFHWKKEAYEIPGKAVAKSVLEQLSSKRAPARAHSR